VALFNILEERDIQIRGYRIRLPLDLLLVATANPEDYTHRGRIISPLKDRFGTQVRTHYPRRTEHEIAIMDQEASPPPPPIPTLIPRPLKEVIAAFTAQLRASPAINQRSGVSVRFSIGAMETVAASALRRAARLGEDRAVARPVDLWVALDSLVGRVEFDALEEGRESEVMRRALRKALLEVWRRRLGGEDFGGLVDAFEHGLVVETSELSGATELLGQLGRELDALGLDRVVRRLELGEESADALASALEFCLEGLHLTKRINKSGGAVPGSWSYGEVAS
jgi:magnesium chelatase subunit I